jgi:predicted ATPase
MRKGRNPVIEEVRVGGFKAFGDSQSLPLRPITLLYGPNSAGKSSVVHSLAYLHELAVRGRYDVGRCHLGGSGIDLGGYPRFVHRREAQGRVQLGVTFTASEELTSQLGVPDGAPISCDFGVGLLRPAEATGRDAVVGKERCGLASLAVGVGGAPLFRLARNDLGPFGLFDLQPDPAWPALESQLRLRRPNPVAVFEHLEGLVGISGEELVPKKVDLRLESTLPKRGARRVGLKNVGEAELFKQALAALLALLGRDLGAEFQRLRYLGPLRAYPPRWFADDQFDDPNWQAGGGFAWRVLAEDARVRERVNQWLREDGNLRTPYELVLEHFLPAERLGRAFADVLYNERTRASDTSFDGDLDAAEAYAGLDADAIVRETSEEAGGGIPSLSLLDANTRTLVSHRDVGVGISQVLPVLVSAFGSRDSLVMIEQPELHLHPALQAELADAFVEAAFEGRNRFLLETHSEHLVLRIMRRLRERGAEDARARPLLPSDIAILFVEPTPKGSRVVPIPLREDGEFGGPWPNGFFPERMRELM